LNRFGYNSSPIIEGNKVILSKDFGDDRFLLALDTNTGDIIWKKELSPVGLSNDVFSTPVVNNNQIILHRGNEISSYSLTNGTRLWWFPVNTMGTSTPVVYNNTIFVSAWSNMSDKEQYTNPLSFNEFLRKYDKNTNGTISIEEIPEDLFIYQRNEIKDIPSTSGSYKKFFGFFDSNNNGEITSNEYDTCFKMLESFYRESGFIALSPENSGELNYSSLLWSVKEHAPEVPSPLIYNDNAYLIKDGGILTCVDLKSGQVHFRERVGNSGLYLASPVAANGHVFLLSYNGKLKVIKATDNYEVAGEYDFKEKISATPAIIGNAIYIRTAKSLYAFWN
jgi:outer membrane protein assembly factor BamB